MKSQGPTVKRLCACGSCEDAVFRALGVVEKSLLDGECTVFTAAVGIGMAAIASDVMNKQIEGIYTDKGVPALIATLMANDSMIAAMNDISAIVKQYYDGKVYDAAAPITMAINAAIEKANKRHAEEQKLPKGD